MANSFFQTLNPFSTECPQRLKNQYNDCADLSIGGYLNYLKHHRDFCLTNKSTGHKEYSLSEVIFNGLMGSHYEQLELYHNHCAKGILDILIFPLIARNLLLYCWDRIYKMSIQGNITDLLMVIDWLGCILGMIVAALLEGIRFFIAIGITIPALLIINAAILTAAFIVGAPYFIAIGIYEFGKNFGRIFMPCLYPNDGENSTKRNMVTT